MVKFKKFAGTVLAAAIISVCGIAFMPKTTVYAANYEIKVESGKTYAYDENGVKASGWKTINGNEYYFGEDGAAVTGIQLVQYQGLSFIFYFDESGVLQCPDGWLTVDGKTYYFSIWGDKSKSTAERGYLTIIDEKYYLTFILYHKETTALNI